MNLNVLETRSNKYHDIHVASTELVRDDPHSIWDVGGSWSIVDKDGLMKEYKVKYYSKIVVIEWPSHVLRGTEKLVSERNCESSSCKMFLSPLQRSEIAQKPAYTVYIPLTYGTTFSSTEESCFQLQARYWVTQIRFVVEARDSVYTTRKTARHRCAESLYHRMHSERFHRRIQPRNN